MALSKKEQETLLEEIRTEAVKAANAAVGKKLEGVLGRIADALEVLATPRIAGRDLIPQDVAPAGTAARETAEHLAAKADTADDVRAALRAKSQRDGKEAAVAVLAGLKAKSVSDLKPSQYAGAIAACAA